MASKCKSCDKAVMNSDFIKCEGICGDIYHLKCVGLSKAALATVSNCPNICWFCQECNGDRRNVSSSIQDMKNAIDRLGNSLSSDILQFLDGFRLLMDKLFETSGSINSNAVNIPGLRSTHNVHCEDIKIADSPNAQGKRVIESNVEETQIAASQPTNSVVISNIDKEVSANYLRNFLADVLTIERENIDLSLLMPIGKTINDMEFLQYKLTVPRSKYKIVIDPNTWPKNVRVRDFVYKPKKVVRVDMQDFLNKSNRG